MPDFARRDVRSPAESQSQRSLFGKYAVGRWRWLICVLVTVSLPLVLLFVQPVAPQNGLMWDLLMGAGMLAAGLVISAPIVAPRVWMRFADEPNSLREILFFHRDLSYLALVLVLLHAFGLLAVDWTLIEYFKLSAPWSMLAALLATGLLVAIVVSSIYRIRLNIRYKAWRVWHIGLSVLTVALLSFHILDAGYFINSPIKKAIFVVLAAGPTLVVFGVRARHAQPSAQRSGHIVAGNALLSGRRASRRFSLRVVTLLAVLWMSSIFIFAVPKSGSRAESESFNCLANQCESPQ